MFHNVHGHEVVANFTCNTRGLQPTGRMYKAKLKTAVITCCGLTRWVHHLPFHWHTGISSYLNTLLIASNTNRII